jgi:hypothetical protein
MADAKNSCCIILSASQATGIHSDTALHESKPWDMTQR